MDFDLRKPKAEFLRSGEAYRMSKRSFSLAVDSREIGMPAVGESFKHIPIAVHPIKDLVERVALPRLKVVVPLKTELRLSHVLLWIANDAFPGSHLIRPGQQGRC